MLFFFSSRRRHTRFDCDWSSDVCSSDLNGEARDTASDIWNKRIDTYNKVMCDPQIPQSVKEEMIENIKPRSEEHTSELQSQSNLVCRLLLEKKKQQGQRLLRSTSVRC